MNVMLYKSINDTQVEEETLTDVIKIEESADFGLVITQKQNFLPNSSITEKREIHKHDILLILPLNIFLREDKHDCTCTDKQPL